MKTKTLRLRGIEEGKDKQIAAKLDGRLMGLTPKGRVRLGTARDAGGEVTLTGMQEDDLVCVHYSNGFKLWTRVDDMHRAHPAQGTSRSARGEANPDAAIWEIDPRVEGVGGERGLAGLVVEALDFFGLDLKEVAAEKLALLLENKKLHGKAPGLFRCALDGAFALAPAARFDPAEQGPLLVFVHGTGSNGEGSFGALWDPRNGKGAELRREMAAHYPAGVYAYEHRTLTHSPIDNALELAALLPAGTELHLVSHSRGGLIGELMCLGQRQDKKLFDSALLDRLFAEDRTQVGRMGFGKRDRQEFEAAYGAERKKLEKLLVLLDKKQFRVSRFVRVACPARGTTLASARLDRWLSVLGWLAPEFLDDGMDFFLGVVKKRTDPRTLPGLEAMMPGSALVGLLNHPDLIVDADLSVIAGDIEGDSLWTRMKWLVTDWFYTSDHDLVVNTGSMYGGARRPDKGARFCFDQGKEVCHFNYFSNRKTVEALLTGLTRADDMPDGFEPIAEARQEIPASRAAVTRSATMGARPVVVVLPGTMGSELAQAGNRIWLSYLDLARGLLARLGRDAERVQPLGLLEDYYGALMIYLSSSHQVVPFAYDWRLSVLDSADKLAAKVGDLLNGCEQNRQPIRFLAHSMGGLVARAMIARHPDLWERVSKLDGSRLIMLGTPNAGSFEAVRWLTGFNPTMAKITLLDGPHDRDEIIDIVRRYPGLLELLPARGVRDFAQPGLWETLKTDAEETWPLPEPADLANLTKTWSVIGQSPVDPDRMLYVAGWAPRTVCDYEVKDELMPWDPFNKHKVLRFYANRKGDGTVPWDLGLLNDVKTWYVAEAAHDELPCYEPAFPAYLDLLQTGRTERLSDVQPLASRTATDAVEVFSVPLETPDSLPSEAETRKFVFGGSPPRAGGKKRRQPRIRVSICHGDLAYAQNPVCVGHYRGDSIVSSEAALDRHLNGMLSQRMRLGLYPGPLGSHEIFISPDRNAKPGGAIVIGLGQVGELSPGALEEGFARMALEYALTVANWADNRFGDEATVRSARLTSLLIGTGAGSLKVADSMRAIMRGAAAANRRLIEAGFDDRVLLDEIEFLDLYQDIAIQAARSLDSLFSDGALADAYLCLDRTVCERDGGRRRVTCEEDANWWRRLEISYDHKRDELRFIALTDKARAEESLVAGQLRLAEDFIREAQRDAGNDDEAARTLFEMLLPNRLKELAPDQYDVVLVLDELSASFPWEMLKDGWSVNGKPLAVAAGMLRQFKTAVYRSHPVYPPGQKAYVVGNPKLPADTGGLRFPDLPGAVVEAEEVTALLKKEGFEVTARIDASARDILVGLHGDGYRVLHLAGHGVHELEIEIDESGSGNCGCCEQPLPKRRKRISGMVIGKDVFLTPGDVEQMRWVPELVFINCCHLGSSLSGNPAWTRYSALAANLATQFIDMGVKAVVAAGWAVDDGAARDFALGFYRRMLDGEGFGRAVQAARADIYERHPGVNTWGAYQCYGDPDYRLVNRAAGSQYTKKPFNTSAELVAELHNLANSIRMGWSGTASAEAQLRAIDDLLLRIPGNRKDDWLGRADVSAALGVVHGERADSSVAGEDVIGAFDAAIQAFDIAIQAEKADIPVRALEQRANFQVKRAWHMWRLARAKPSLKGRKLNEVNETCARQVAQARGELEFLLRLGVTTERLSLIASAYKREAWIALGKGGKEPFADALAMMAKYYLDAWEAKRGKGKLDAYPLSNWLDAEAMLVWFRRKPHADEAVLKSAATWCREAIKQAERQTAPNFWNETVAPDCRLALALAQGGLTEAAADEIAEGYRSAIARGCSPKEKGSVLEHLDFLIEMAEPAGKKDLVARLGQIRRCLS